MLCAFALSQPLLDILGRNPTFFAVRDSTATEIVLFALALVLVPPAVLLAAEAVVGLIGAAAGRGLHLVFVSALVALIALHVLTNNELLSGAAALVVAVALGAGGAVLYARAGALRSVLSVLAPAPLVFGALFLFGSQASDLIFASTPVVQAASFEARTSVVLLVFDELSTVSLMNGKEKIDAKRFPNFASLARDSTWYRSATTEYGLTEGAVPSVLTGRTPKPSRAPVYAQYPKNIFTLLGKRYRMRVVESLTSLCPRNLCRAGGSKYARAVDGKTESLVSDAGIVFLHLVVPKPYVERVPAIDESWGNFGRDTQEQTVRRAGKVLPCGRNVCAFANLIDGSPRPTLYLLHTLLPHVPYEYLPSGRRYALDAPDLAGQRSGRWADRAGMLASQQRYLLQLGYADRALGLILRKLRATGTYRRALVIATADHGVSYRMGEPRRLPTHRNLQDIAFVPLFVKLPGQRQARIVDAGARTVDVLPTIARVLGIKSPWRLDGRPLTGNAGDGSTTASMILGGGGSVSAPLGELRARRSETLRAQIATFGTGSFSKVYRVGPTAQLAGRKTVELASGVSRGRVELDGAALFDAVDPASGFVPTYVSGTLSGLGSGTHELAIAANGRVAVTTTSYQDRGERFTALIPEEALRRGRNAIEVLALHRGASGIRLQALNGGGSGTVLRDRNGTLTLERPGERAVAVAAGALRGDVTASRKGAAWVFTGWAADPKAKRPAASLVVLADGREVFRVAARAVRPQRVLGQKVPHADYGFEFPLPSALLPPRGADHSVRVFAVRGRVASEPRYGAGYPWSHS